MSEESLPTQPQRGFYAPEAQRMLLSATLMNEGSANRNVVWLEDSRAAELLHEQYTDPYIHSPRIMRLGRNILAKVGLYNLKQPQLVEQPQLEDNQERKKELIALELDYSRRLLRNNTLWGIDDVAIDRRLNIREDDSIVPAFLRQQHQQAEQTLGVTMSFMTWVAEHATDDQLLNVWQWHEAYLRRHNNDPAFREQLERVKEGYKQGLKAAIAAEELDPAMETDPAQIDSIEVEHGSPFSPILAVARAYIGRDDSYIGVREDITDYELYHEFTHMIKEGFVTAVDEGGTEIIATTIYNYAHPASEHVSLDDSEYSDQVAALQTVARITEGGINNKEMSRHYAGSNVVANTLELAEQVDSLLGAPLLTAILIRSQDFMCQHVGTHNAEMVHRATQMFLRHNLDVLATIVLDGDNLVVHNLGQYVERVFSPEVSAVLGSNGVREAMDFARHTLIMQGELPAGQDGNVEASE